MIVERGAASLLLAHVGAGLAAVQELVLPVPCTGCGAVGPPICPDCRSALHPAPERRLIGSPPLPVFSGWAYEGVARSVVLAFKNEGRTEHAPVLAAALLAALALAAPTLDRAPGRVPGLVPELVPMPATVRSSRNRGYDPVRVVLRRARLPARHLLRLRRRGADQRELGWEARQANAAGSMQSLPAAGLGVLLVDDVVTTGATLLEAARAVRAAGGTVFGAVTVASTPERSRRREIPFPERQTTRSGSV